MKKVSYSQRQMLFLVVLRFLLLVGLLVARRTERLIEGVWTLKLVGGCYLGYHISNHALALACPGVDYIRLLPVEQPWEDLTDWLEWNARVICLVPTLPVGLCEILLCKPPEGAVEIRS